MLGMAAPAARTGRAREHGSGQTQARADHR